MKLFFCFSFIPVILVNSVFAQSVVEPIANDWRAPETLRRIHVSTSIASTELDPANGNYISVNAHDGHRHTKWVAAVSPSPQAPQWIDLKFAGKQRVSAVAVFGERIGNDGIVDAKIEIANNAGELQSIAAITNATSGSWVARFPDTNTSRIRLLINRSSGPSPHTDVYEVETYGPRLSAAELHQQAETRLAEIHERLPMISAAIHTLKNAAWFGGTQRLSQSLATRFETIKERFAQWNDLPAADQQMLAEELDLISEQANRLQDSTTTLNTSFTSELAALQSAHTIFSNAEKATREHREGGMIELFNQRVLLQFDESKNLWSAFWNGAADAAVFHAGFDLQVDGKQLQPKSTRNEVADFSDKSGEGRQLTQHWGAEVEVERVLRVYDAGAITISARVKNVSTHAVSLGLARPLIVAAENKSALLNGDVIHMPAAVYIVGASEWQCTPGRAGRSSEQNYSSTQVLNLTDSETRQGLTIGFLSAFTARPDLNAQFRSGRGGLGLSAQQNFLNRRLDPGESLEFDPLYLKADDDAYAGLEKYAETVSHFSQEPVRQGATALWCSWYGHRMAISEELTLSNAAVAARYLQPLGFEIMQLDHGWQVGDVTGNWTPDPESFPHGFKWLAQELKARYGLKLGLWIAPTDVAETSEIFRQHPEWMLKDAQGKPLVNWKWYWKPNPNCYELDVSNPDAAKWMENAFAQLSTDGVSYYKIDFIAASAGEQFVQQNPKITRGWSVLRQAMESVRRGAGTNAWIRYCQPPPLLSAGLADSAYGGDDTLDAGLNGDIHVLRSNARSLAASYWINDRLYHREVCDLSVRMQADIEEVRMRLALMTLANCSISFSDELQYLPLSRLRMMQACLPPGNPPMKPLDLFEREIPSVWRVHCTADAEEWDIVGLFNFENAPETRTIDFARLSLPTDTEVGGFEFWEQHFGTYRTNLTITLPPQTSRIFALRPLQKHPQIVGTDLHLLQGQHELKKVSWDEKSLSLSGECERAAGIEGKLFVHVPAGYTPHFEFPLNEKSARLTHVSGNIWAYELTFHAARENWNIPFDRK